MDEPAAAATALLEAVQKVGVMPDFPAVRLKAGCAPVLECKPNPFAVCREWTNQHRTDRSGTHEHPTDLRSADGSARCAIDRPTGPIALRRWAEEVCMDWCACAAQSAVAGQVRRTGVLAAQRGVQRGAGAQLPLRTSRARVNNRPPPPLP